MSEAHVALRVHSMNNRAIVLTPPGPGAIAVVRLVGPAVTEFLCKHFSKSPAPGRCVHGILADGVRTIDDPVVVLLPNGQGADLNLHGGPWVVRSLLDLARQAGFESVEPHADGPSPFDAVEGETILAREVLAHLPLARTELGLRVLLAQTQAWFTFKASQPTHSQIQQVLDDVTLLRLLHPPTVAIVGAANVGKSTLANQLFGQERSITADMAGTTRDWVGEIANVNGLPVLLLDTPGQRPTSDAIEQAAIERSRAKIEESHLIVLVLDATRALSSDQTPLLNAYPDALRVVNKSDRPRAWNERHIAGIHTVATTGQGVAALREAIAGHFGCGNIDMIQPRWWTQRQRELLLRATNDAAALAEI